MSADDLTSVFLSPPPQGAGRQRRSIHRMRVWCVTPGGGRGPSAVSGRRTQLFLRAKRRRRPVCRRQQRPRLDVGWSRSPAGEWTRIVCSRPRSSAVDGDDGLWLIAQRGPMVSWRQPFWVGCGQLYTRRGRPLQLPVRYREQRELVNSNGAPLAQTTALRFVVRWTQSFFAHLCAARKKTELA